MTKPQQKQSIFDLTVQNYGDLNEVVKFSKDNALNINNEPDKTKDIIVEDSVELGNEKNKNAIKLKRLSFNNELIPYFNPLSLNPILWLDSKEGVMDLEQVGADTFIKTWYDKSGNGNNASQSDESYRFKLVDNYVELSLNTYMELQNRITISNLDSTIILRFKPLTYYPSNYAGQSHIIGSSLYAEYRAYIGYTSNVILGESNSNNNIYCYYSVNYINWSNPQFSNLFLTNVNGVTSQLWKDVVGAERTMINNMYFDRINNPTVTGASVLLDTIMIFNRALTSDEITHIDNYLKTR